MWGSLDRSNECVLWFLFFLIFKIGELYNGLKVEAPSENEVADNSDRPG